jgi:succinate dehydrogenase/fumarate reductase flavoprotein subunit
VAANERYDVRRGSILEPRSQPRPTNSDAVSVNIQDVTYSLKSLMWRQMGVVRNEQALRDALPKIELWSHAVASLAPGERATWELRNMLDVARLAIIGALERRESRGVHFRADHPRIDSALESHTLLRAEGDRESIEGWVLDREPVAGSVGVA